MTNENKNQSAIETLTEVINWLEAHPELPELYLSNIGVFVTWGATDMKRDMAIVARAMGKVVKNYSDDRILLAKHFGTAQTANISYVADRDAVCERIQVGTKVVPEHFIPAAPETVIPAQEVPVYEWRCGSVLAADPLQEVA